MRFVIAAAPQRLVGLIHDLLHRSQRLPQIGLDRHAGDLSQRLVALAERLLPQTDRFTGIPFEDCQPASIILGLPRRQVFGEIGLDLQVVDRGPEGVQRSGRIVRRRNRCRLRRNACRRFAVGAAETAVGAAVGVASGVGRSRLRSQA